MTYLQLLQILSVFYYEAQPSRFTMQRLNFNLRKVVQLVRCDY